MQKKADVRAQVLGIGGNGLKGLGGRSKQQVVPLLFIL
jgi:hypothetical protein